ncbi:MAG: hypothetical protein AB8H79_03385 [Myxococcota bacterium]
MLRAFCAIALISWTAQDCAPDMVSTGGQWSFNQENLVDKGFGGSPYRVLVGSTVCPLPGTLPLTTDADISQVDLMTSCVERTATGSVSAQGDCFTVDAAGEGSWDLKVYADCPHELTQTPEPDAVQIFGVDLDDVRSAPESVLEPYAGDPGASNTDVPADAAIGDTLFVLGAGWSEVRVRLVDDQNRRVAWPLDDGAVRLDGGEVEVLGRGRLKVSMPAGSEGVVQARLPSGTVDLVRIVGVASDNVVSMELVAPLKTVPLDDALIEDVPDVQPATYIDEAWALYRDRDGNIVWGVPTEWRTAGTRALLMAPNAPNPSRLRLLDECEPIQAGRHRLKAQARSATRGIDLQKTTTFRYRYPAETLDAMRANGDLNDDNFTPDERCAGQARGCATIPTGPAAGWALVLGGLVVLGRRRSGASTPIKDKTPPLTDGYTAGRAST